MAGYTPNGDEPSLQLLEKLLEAAKSDPSMAKLTAFMDAFRDADYASLDKSELQQFFQSFHSMCDEQGLVSEHASRTQDRLSRWSANGIATTAELLAHKSSIVQGSEPDPRIASVNSFFSETRHFVLSMRPTASATH